MSAVANVVQGECCLCGTRISVENDSEEHVILNAIGGRKVFRGVVCRKCNETAGTTWDAELAHQLNPLCLFFRISRQRGAIPRRVFETSGKGPVAVTETGLELAKPEILETTRDGKQFLSVRARNAQQARIVLEGLKRKRYPTLDVEATLAHAIAAQRDEYLDDFVNMQISIGGLVSGRSFVKSAFVLAAASGVPPETMKEGRKYLRGDNTPCFDYINRLDDPILNRPTDTIFHCVAVQAVNGMLLGYLELFSIYRILICLSKHYDGPVVNGVVAVNPLDGTILDLQIGLNLSLLEVEEIFKDPGPESHFLNRSFGAAIEIGMRRQLCLEYPRAVERAIAKAWAALQLKEGQDLSLSDRQRFFHLIAEAMAPFYIHANKMGFQMFRPEPPPTPPPDAGTSAPPPSSRGR